MEELIKARCNRVLGVGAASEILYRIRFWYPKRKIRRRGRRWVAKTHEDMAFETGMSLDQVRRGKKDLEAGGYIETCIAKFGGRNHTHYRLLPKAFTKVLGEVPVQICTITPVQICTTIPVQDCTLPYTGSYGQGDNRHGVAAAGGHVMKDGGGKGLKVNRRKSGRQVADVVAKAMAAAPAELPDIVTVAGVFHVWRTVWVELYGGYVPGWTGKQQGLVKSMLKRTDYDPAIFAAVEAMMRDWLEFTVYAAEKFGVKNLKERPTINVLSNFPHVVMAFFHEEAGKGVQSTAQPGLASIMSSDELFGKG